MRSSRGLELIVHLALYASLAYPIVLSCLCVWLNVDSMQPYLSPRSRLIYMICIPVRIILPILVLIELPKSSIVLLILSKIIGTCSTQAVLALRMRIKFDRKLLLDSIKLYWEIVLFHEYVNQMFCWHSVPPLILFGCRHIVLLNYGTIRLRGIISNLYYSVVPLVTLIAYMFPVTLLPEEVRVHEGSIEFLATVRRQEPLTKYERRVIYSMRRVGIRCGQFGVMSTTWAVKMMEIILNYTATMLLTF